MKRRCFLAGLTVAAGAGAFAPTERKPNMIYILLDDAGYGDFGCYGQRKIETPVIDKLAREGMKFTNHYAGCTVCAPSRCALMTGYHTGHSYVRGNKEMVTEGQHPIPADTVTIPKVLKQAGYATGLVGKWGLGAPGTHGEPNRQGFDYFFGFNCQRRAHKHYPPTLNENGKTVELPYNRYGSRHTYVQDLFRQKGIEFITQNKDKPFFLYLALNTPHAELLAPRDGLWEKYAAKGWPETAFVEDTQGRAGDDLIGAYASQDFPNVAYATMVSRIDRDIGKLMECLKQCGIDDNTVVMFTSDNGPHQEGGCQPEFFNSNGPFSGVKRDLLDGGIRMPFIVRWPGRIKPGATSNHLSAFWDVLPTCAELAGIPAPQGIDGLSFAPTLLGKGGQRQHEYLYWEFHRSAFGKPAVNQAIRRGDWKAIRRGLTKGAKPPVILFNLKDDVEELSDVAKQYPDMVKKMEKLFEQARTESEIFPIM
ncbi:MAG: arylsulfatase [Kiritimatiellales bacterium]|nr:arylsulfatase [Kiritimatiellales bacterium]